MSNKIRIVGISGSLRGESYNTAALRAAAELAPPNVELQIADLADIPLYNQELRDRELPAAVTQLSDAIAAADAVLFATPEYNYSIPGVLKNAIDWVSRQSPQPLAGKPAAVMSASMGMLGGVRAHYDLRKILVYLDVHFINKPEVMIAQAQQKFDASGALVDEMTRDFVRQQIAALCDWAERLQRG
ncbi:NAD(P)H-dependent oxidoreductase [Microbulbifer sp. SAOS-129_SWC]|uniref:NADPH-dependent FMN reductase n=1 Tax=Microbulbifer sp. SAOS-129_SWC TaxID=3145235 RepID=UPI0032168FF7